MATAAERRVIERNIEGNKYKKIEAAYTKGGMNYFNYQNEKRGIYLYCSTVERDGHFETFVPMASDNFKIFILELGRKSAKKESMVWDAIKKREEALLDAYVNNDRKRIFDLVEEIKKEVE